MPEHILRDLLIAAVIVGTFMLVLRLAGRHRDPESFRMKRPTLITFPKDSPGYAIGLKQREGLFRDEALFVDAERRRRLDALIEFQKANGADPAKVVFPPFTQARRIH